MKHAKDIYALYINDLSEAEAVELKRQLISDSVTRPYPLNYHERTQHIFPSDASLLQKHLNNVDNFTQTNHRRINELKSKL